jgi:hypothetical protein
MIVLDDLMTIAGKDKRISDLFCEGSHHRNLSVCLIAQTVFYSKDPTQRRNCQYMALFKSPSDKQQIMTLARMMYPGNSQMFMQRFDEATSKPHGQLFVDLKPETPESDRLQSNILDVPMSLTKALANVETPQSESEPESDRLQSNILDVPVNLTKSLANVEKPQSVPKQQGDDTTDDKLAEPENTMVFSCDDCGVMFENVHDLQRHVKRSCPEKMVDEQEKDNTDDMNIPHKWETSHNIGPNEDIHDNVGFQRLRRRTGQDVWDDQEEYVQSKLKEYIEKGMDEKSATKKSEMKTLSYEKARFRETYGRMLGYMHDFKKTHVHNEIVKTIEELRRNGVKNPVSVALYKLDYMFSPLFDEIVTGDSEEETDNDNDDVETEEDNSSAEESIEDNSSSAGDVVEPNGIYNSRSMYPPYQRR